MAQQSYQQGNRRKFPSKQETDISLEFKKEWIQNGINSECVSFTEKLAKKLASELYSGERLTTSQIRIVFGEIKRIQLKGFNKEKTSFVLLKPKMAYAAGRHNKQGVKIFKDVFDKAHNAVNAEGENAEYEFQNFTDFFESTLAYHKAFGGKE